MRILANILRTFKVSSRESCKITNRRYSSQICPRIRGSSSSVDSPALNVVCVRSFTTTPVECKSSGTADTFNSSSGNSDSINQIIPVALLKTESELDASPVKVLVIPINLFNNDKEAVQKTMSTMSVIRANADQIDAFTDNAAAFVTKNSAKNSNVFGGPKRRVEEPLWQDFDAEPENVLIRDGLDEAIAEHEVNRIKPRNSFDALDWNDGKAYIIADVPPNLEKRLGDAGIASMDLAFEMDMTNIKDALMMRHKQLHEVDEFDDPVTMTLRDPMISMTTSVETDSFDLNSTVPLNFNALIQGTVNIDSSKLTPKQIEDMKVPQFNDYVTSMAANICSTALQKGFPTDLSRMYSTKTTSEPPKRPRSPHVVCERQGDKGCVSPGNVDLDPYVPKASKGSNGNGNGNGNGRSKSKESVERSSCQCSETSLLTSTIIGDTGARGLMSCKAYAIALKEAERLREVFAAAKKAKAESKCAPPQPEKKCDERKNPCEGKKTEGVNEKCPRMPCGPPKQESICKDKILKDPPANEPGHDRCFPQDPPCKKAESKPAPAVLCASEAKVEQQCAPDSDPPCKNIPFKCPIPEKKDKGDQKEWDNNPCRQNYPKQCPPKTSVGGCKRPIVDPCAPKHECPKPEEKKSPPPCPPQDPCKKGGKQAAATQSSIAAVKSQTSVATKPKENFTFKACEAFRKACGKRTAPKDCEAPAEAANCQAKVEKKPEPIKCATEKKPEPVKCAEKKPEPVKCAEKKPEPVKCAEKKPEPVKCAEKKPETVKCAEKKPEPVKCAEKKPEPAKCGTEKKPEPAKCGTEKKPEPAKCGTEKKPEPTKCVTEKKPEPVKCGTEKKPEPAKCGAETKTEASRGTSQKVDSGSSGSGKCTGETANPCSEARKFGTEAGALEKTCDLISKSLPTNLNFEAVNPKVNKKIATPKFEPVKCSAILTAESLTDILPKKAKRPRNSAEKLAEPNKTSVNVDLCRKSATQLTKSENSKSERRTLTCAADGSKSKQPKKPWCGPTKNPSQPTKTESKPLKPWCGPIKEPSNKSNASKKKFSGNSNVITHCPNTATREVKSTKPNCPKMGGSGGKSARCFSNIFSRRLFTAAFSSGAALPLTNVKFGKLFMGPIDFYSTKGDGDGKKSSDVDCPASPPRPKNRVDIKYEKGLKDCFLQDRLDEPCSKPPPKDPKNTACNKKPEPRGCWDELNENKLWKHSPTLLLSPGLPCKFKLNQMQLRMFSSSAVLKQNEKKYKIKEEHEENEETAKPRQKLPKMQKPLKNKEIENEIVRIGAAGEVLKVAESIQDVTDYDVLVRVGAIALSGSDIHVYETGGDKCTGITIGHDATGIVEKVGKCVDKLKPGDCVAMESGLCCGICDVCKQGNYNLCPQLFHNGFFSTHQTHPADLCHKLPDNVTLEDATLTSILALGLQACFKAEITPTTNVLVIGTSPKACAAALCARALGAKSVAVMAPNVYTLESIRILFDFDYIHYYENETNLMEKLTERVCTVLKDRPNVVINYAISESSMNMAISLLKPGGKCVLSECDNEYASFNAMDVLMKSISLVTSFRSANMFPAALNLMKSGKTPIGELVSRIYTWDQIKWAFHWAQYEANMGNRKVIVQGPDLI